MAPPPPSFSQWPLAELCAQCQKQMALYRQRQDYEPGYCFEVARRALELRDEEAWRCFHERFSGLVEGWVRRHSSFSGNTHEVADLTQASFLQLLKQFRTGQKTWADFHSLAGLLKYVQLCVNSAVVNLARKNPLTEPLDKNAPTPIELPNLDTKALWSAVEARLKTKPEQLAIYERFVFDLSPREIAQRHPQHFASALAVSRVIANVLARLRRDQDFWAGFSDR